MVTGDEGVASGKRIDDRCFSHGSSSASSDFLRYPSLSKKSGIYHYTNLVYLTEDSCQVRHYGDVLIKCDRTLPRVTKSKLIMVLIRRQPDQEIEMQRHIERIFARIAGSRREPELTWKPAIELKNTEEYVILRVEIPGVSGKDLDIQVTREAVAIAGERRYDNKAQDKGLFCTEFRYGKFHRVIPLPVAVVNDQVKAEFKDGILTLTLPIAQRRQAVKINLVDTNTATSKAATQANQTETAQAV